MPFTPYQPSEDQVAANPVSDSSTDSDSQKGGFRPYIPPQESASESSKTQVTPNKKPISTFGLWESLNNASKKINETHRGLIMGQLKGVGSTLAGLGSLGEKALNAADEKLFPNLGIKASDQTAGSKLKEGPLKGKNTAEKIGKATEQIGELLTPIGIEENVASKIPGLVEKAPKAIQEAVEIGAKGLSRGIEGAGVTAAQEGDLNKNVAASGLLGVASVGGEILSKGLSKIGDSIFASAIPSTITQRAKDLRKELNIGEAVGKTGISLTKKSLINKVSGRINALGSELDKAVSAATEAGVSRSFDDIAKNVEKSLQDAKLAKELQLTPIDMEEAGKALTETLDRYKQIYGGKDLPANAQQQLKRDIGTGLIKVFDKNMNAPIKAKALTEKKLYGELDSFLDANIKNYKPLNQQLAPLLEGKERLMSKGNYSPWLTDIVAGSLAGSTGGSIIDDPAGFMKNALLGVLIKRGVGSTAAKTMSGSIVNSLSKAIESPQFYQIIRKLIQSSSESSEEVSVPEPEDPLM